MIRVNGVKVDYKKFPDGTLMMLDFPIEKIVEIREEFELEQTVIEWHFECLEEQIVLYNIVKHLRETMYHPPSLVLKMDYLPNSRLDRTYSDEEIFTLKYFCDFINDLHFSLISINDCHSSVGIALLNNCVHNNMCEDINFLLEKLSPTFIFYPDNGAHKKYSKFIKYPNAHGEKRRDWRTGEILCLDIIHSPGLVLQDANVLIIDDICSYGTTFVKSAEALRATGVNKIWLYITHAENNILKGQITTCGLFEKVYTTNSIYTEQHELIEVI